MVGVVRRGVLGFLEVMCLWIGGFAIVKFLISTYSPKQPASRPLTTLLLPPLSPSSSFSNNCGAKDKPLVAARQQNDKAMGAACLLLLSCLQFSFKTIEISVCRLLMAIQSLWMAVQRLRMCIQSLQTEISLLLLEEFMLAPLRFLRCF